ncbi:MAG: hypothetical protein Q9227_001429 [Pyrenula ochraceoflavens]
MTAVPSVSKIAIVGGGPSGVAVAKFLAAEKVFTRIDVFEQRNNVGGIWNYTPLCDDPACVPQTNPHQLVEQPKWVKDGVVNGFHREAEPIFDSALYDELETNIPHTLMQYGEQPFPAGTALFPRHEDVLRYLEEYAEDVRHLITFETQVLDVRLHDAQACNWEVKTKNIRSGATKTDIYDAVVVANGHYNVPYIPDIDGIRSWSQAYPGSIEHSKSYRNNRPFANKKVVVVGNSASGVDIGAQIGHVCQQPLLISLKSESFLEPAPAAWKAEMPQIEQFLPPGKYNRAVRFVDGRIEESIDQVLFATGYLYSYPFLSSIEPPIITSGTRTNNIYRQLFHIEYPTLAFIVLNLRIIPFPMAENQGSVLARVWSGRLQLPSKDAMREDEQKTIEERGNGKGFHMLKFPNDANYINELYDWAESADKRAGYENDGHGKMGTRWYEKAYWTRGRFPALKKAYQSKGPERSKVKRIEDLGFNFEEWKREQRQGSQEFG